MKQTGKFFSTVFTALYTLLENLLGFIFLALIGIYFAFIFLLSFVGPAVILILLLWEWSFIGERNLLISEQFETEDRIFQKMTELSFSTDVATQSVIVKLESPTRKFFEEPYIHERVDELNFSYFWSKLFGQKTNIDAITSRQMRSFIFGAPPIEYTEKEKKYLKKRELQSENLKILRDDFTPISQLLISLDNCTVESQKDWVCQDQIPFLRGSHSYIGSSDNEWIIDYKQHGSKFFNHQFFNWKTLWWFEKRKCSNFCFIETVKSWDANEAKREAAIKGATEMLRRMMKEQKSKHPD